MLMHVFHILIAVCFGVPAFARAASGDTALATGHRLLRERRYDEAVVYLQAALDSTKRPGPVAKYLAFCFARTGQYDDAIALLERLCEAGQMGRSLVDQETDGIRAFVKARSLADSGQFAAAAALLEPVAARTSPATLLHLDAAVALGRARFAQHDFAGAADAYRLAADAGEQWAYPERALLRHARSLLECQCPGEAVALLDEHHGILSQPLPAAAQEAIADAYVSHADNTLNRAANLPRTGRLILASQILTRGYGCLRTSDDPACSGRVIASSSRVGQLAQAANGAKPRTLTTSNIQRSTDRTPGTNDQRPHTELRTLNTELSSPPTRVLLRLAQVQTELAQLWLAEGQAALAVGNTASASEHFWRATEECPHADRQVWLANKKNHNQLHWAAHEQLRQVFRKHLRGRDFATAAQAFHDVAWAYPYTTPGARAFYFEAKCLRDLGEPGRAEALFTSFLKKHSHSHLASTVCYQLGQQAASDGKPKDALKWYERALDDHPTGANADLCAFLIAVHHWERKDYPRCGKAAQHLLDHYPQSPLCARAKLMLEYIKRREAARGRKKS